MIRELTEVIHTHTDDQNYTHIDVYFSEDENEAGETVAIVCLDTRKVYFIENLYRGHSMVTEAIAEVLSRTHPFHAAIEKYMAKYRDNAQDWSQATGEISSIHTSLAEYVDPTYTDHLGYSKSPAESNQRHKKGIRHLAGLATPEILDKVFAHYKLWLTGEE